MTSEFLTPGEPLFVSIYQKYFQKYKKMIETVSTKHSLYKSETFEQSEYSEKLEHIGKRRAPKNYEDPFNIFRKS